MIVEIALGIVLAVVILKFWRQILGLGLLLTMLAVVVAIAGGVVYLAVTYPLESAVLGGPLALVCWVAYRDSQYVYKGPLPLNPPDSPTTHRKTIGARVAAWLVSFLPEKVRRFFNMKPLPEPDARVGNEPHR